MYEYKNRTFKKLNVIIIKKTNLWLFVLQSHWFCVHQWKFYGSTCKNISHWKITCT